MNELGLEWVELRPSCVLVASADAAWKHEPAPRGPFSRPMTHAGEVGTTRRLLDAALALAQHRPTPVQPPRSEPEWISRLASLYHTTHATPRVMAAAAARFQRENQDVLANWSRTKVADEAGHDRLALRDLRALGYAAEELVESVVPKRAAALVRWFEGCIDDSRDPIACVGYAYALERLAIERSAAYIAQIQAWLPTGVDATRCLRVHSAAGSDLGHVHDTVELVASLDASQRRAVVLACHETAHILTDPDLREDPPSLESLATFRAHQQEL